MTEFFQKPACKRWSVFILVLLASWAIEIGKASITWASGIDDHHKWNTIPWKHWWNYFWTVAIGFGQVFMNLKSSAWSTATKKELEPALGP